MMSPLDRERAAYALLKERLQAAYGLEDGDEALLDTLEGETGLVGLLERTVRVAKDRQAAAKACADQIAALQARKSRLDDGADRMIALVAETMLEVGIRKLSPGDFSASVRMTKPKPEIVDEAALPEWALATKTVPDRSMIRAKFEHDGEAFNCPGVTVSNGKPSLTVRV